MKRTIVVLGLSTVALAAPARAHHEAIFGPQSSLVLSAPAFASLQTYSRQLGTTGDRRQESTMLLSAGLTPVRSVPLSLTAILPASSIDTLDGSAAARRGMEDIILGARYRSDLPGLQERFGKDGNFLMGMAAVELPTGSVDHAAFSGPFDWMAAALGSVERGPLSAIGYGFYRRHGTDSVGAHVGDNLFLGAGIAYTPFDDPARERLLSFQLGSSYEIYGSNSAGGMTVPATGGRGLYLHPTVVWGPGGRILLFAMTSLPAWEDYRNPADNNRWRVGAGIVFLFS